VSQTLHSPLTIVKPKTGRLESYCTNYNTKTTRLENGVNGTKMDFLFLPGLEVFPP
jgi:hypothetical protein